MQGYYQTMKCYTQYIYLPPTLFTPWMWQVMLIALCDSISFEDLLHKYCSTYSGPSPCPGSHFGSPKKVVAFSDYQGYGKLL